MLRKSKINAEHQLTKKIISIIYEKQYYSENGDFKK